MKDALKSKLEDTKLVAGVVGAVIGVGVTVYSATDIIKDALEMKRIKRQAKKDSETIIKNLDDAKK